MKAEIISTNYCIKLPLEDFKAFWQKLDFLDEVRPVMCKAGAADTIEYDGHFGPHIWFTTDPENKVAVVKVVKELVQKAKQRKITRD